MGCLPLSGTTGFGATSGSFNALALGDLLRERLVAVPPCGLLRVDRLDLLRDSTLRTSAWGLGDKDRALSSLPGGLFAVLVDLGF